jgi:endonuclease YncB( thermonuclease family)
MIFKLPILMALIVAAASDSAPAYGVAVAGDGDSLKIAGISFRLFGIDAPELHQSCSRDSKKWECGAEAKTHLQQLVTGKEVRCVPVGTDQYDRVVARCITRDTDLNKAMIDSGYAVAFRKYSLEYVDAERSAKARRVGLWASTFKLPEEFRAEARSHGQQRTGVRPVRKMSGNSPLRAGISNATWSARASSNCVIKGNHSRRGEWIYHLPGMPYYEQTRAEEIFCTEAEAQAAGYRRARVR